MRILLFFIFGGGGALSEESVLGEYTRAWRLIAQDKPAEAIPILEGVISRDPSFHRAIRLLVDAYSAKRDLAGVERYFESLRRRGPPAGAFALYGIARVRSFEASGRAWNGYLHCIQALPRWPACYADLAWAGQDEAAQLKALIGSDPGNAAAHFGLAGYLSTSLHKPSEALPEFLKALELLADRARDDRELEVMTRMGLAGAYNHLGDRARRVEELERLSLLVPAEDEERRIWLMQNLAGVWRDMRDYPRALRYAESHLELARRTGRLGELAIGLVIVGEMLTEQGRHQEAAEYFKQAVPISGPNSYSRHTPLWRLAEGAMHLGDFAAALRDFESARQVSEEEGNETNVAFSLRYLGNVHFLRGDYARALDCQMRSVEIFRTTRQADRSWQAGAGIGIIGSIYEKLGDFSKAREHYALSLRNARRFEDPQGQQRNLLNLGALQAEMGEYGPAERRLEEAQGLTSRSGLRPNEIQILIALGMLQTRSREFATAVQRLEEALNLAREIQIKALEARALNALGECHLARGALDDAESAWRAALALAEPPEMREMIWPAYSGLGEIARRRGRLAAATLDLRKAVETIESIRAEAGAPEEKVNFLAGKLDAYQRLIDVLTLQKNHREAFEVAEQARARAFLETLAEARASVTAARPLNVAAIQAELARRGKALLEYSLGDCESHAWLVTGHSIAAARLPGRAEIERRVRAFRKVTAVRPRTDAAYGDYEAMAGQLYAMLLRPFENRLSLSGGLTIVPDGILHYLPFEALPAGEHRTIAYAPSATVMVELGRTAGGPKRKELVAYGDPRFRGAENAPAGQERAGDLVRAAYEKQGLRFSPLPNTRREVEGIAGFFPAPLAKVYLGANATKAAVEREDLAGYKRIHFATHAFVDERAPLRSGLALTPRPGGDDDGILRMNEILGLKLNADVVVLSACQTGLGKLVKGEGMVGLTRAFLHAGASRLVVSLWEVNDVATAEFMKVFYGKMKAGLSPAAALREAKRAMRASDVPAYRHPYFWAPFVLVGAP